MNDNTEGIQVETMHRTQPKQPQKNFGNLAKGPNKKNQINGRLQQHQRQYFDSAEYSMNKDHQKKEENTNTSTNKEEQK